MKPQSLSKLAARALRAGGKKQKRVRLIKKKRKANFAVWEAIPTVNLPYAKW